MKKLGSRVWQFWDRLGFRCHLLLGDSNALLIDTMCGFGNLEAAVRQVTSLPVTTVLTHCHFDHIGGAFFFKKAWISLPEQKELALEKSHLATVYANLKRDGLLTAGTPWGSMNGGKLEFCTLEEGKTFDLGGVSAQAVGLPGHTAGSMGFFCPELELLFVGDAITPIMCLFFANSLPVEEYRRTLEKVQKIPFRFFLTSHHARLFPKKSLPDFIACAAFAQKDPGIFYQHDILPEFKGMLHIYRGVNSEEDDFLALILPYVQRKYRRSGKGLL